VGGKRAFLKVFENSENLDLRSFIELLPRKNIKPISLSRGKSLIECIF
jgi:hypothetical protein